MNGFDRSPIRIEPQLRERVWGGRRLRADGPPVGEAWVIHGANRVVSGPGAGGSLADLAATRGEQLLGRRVVDRYGNRVPLLIKLIDAAEWLSVQVHPNDAVARQLEGPGYFGKTEAWFVLESEPGAEIIAGVREGVSKAELERAITGGGILPLVQRMPVQPDQAILLRAGTIHALGPGILVYEVQQDSDLTYRVYDWDRPPSAGRELHIQQAVASADPQASPEPVMAANTEGEQELVACEYFRLQLVTVGESPLSLDTERASFHAVTAIEGTIEVHTSSGDETVAKYDSVIIPACAGSYSIAASGTGRARALVASVP